MKFIIIIIIIIINNGDSFVGKVVKLLHAENVSITRHWDNIGTCHVSGLFDFLHCDPLEN